MLEPEISDKFFQAEKIFIHPSANFNEETTAALREARLISEGKIQSKSFRDVEELTEDLMSDVKFFERRELA